MTLSCGIKRSSVCALKRVPFLEPVKAALREDRAGSSYLASILMSEGQRACLPEALGRAMKVIRCPEANGDDVSSAIGLVRGTFSSCDHTICR